jgi:hypothetical protein
MYNNINITIILKEHAHKSNALTRIDLRNLLTKHGMYDGCHKSGPAVNRMNKIFSSDDK